MAQYVPTMHTQTVARAGRGSAVPGWRRMLFILLSMSLIVSLLVSIRPRPTTSVAHRNTAPEVAESNVSETGNADAAPAAAGAIAAVFAPSVQYWSPQIVAWAQEFGLDPNLVATIMQVESCGDPVAVSSAGAQGLFQVMPFHFQPGEDSLDPDTNARRGLAYFVERLQQTGGDVGRAFAGYNGGHGAAATGWDDWLPETRRYYTWTTGLYGEIQQGNTDSATLQQWQQAGGSSLCRQAAQRLGIN
ncbi:MAG: lytic transglycosylase domain-containing protein [Chloroflexota bacterium]